MSNFTYNKNAEFLTYIWSFCKARTNSVFCLSIVLRISITSPFLKGQVSALPAFFKPTTGSRRVASSSNADLNCANGTVGTPSDLVVANQVSPNSALPTRSFKLKRRPLTVLISIRNLLQSFEASLASLRYFTTDLVS